MATPDKGGGHNHSFNAESEIDIDINSDSEITSNRYPVGVDDPNRDFFEDSIPPTPTPSIVNTRSRTNLTLDIQSTPNPFNFGPSPIIKTKSSNPKKRNIFSAGIQTTSHKQTSENIDLNNNNEVVNGKEPITKKKRTLNLPINATLSSEGLGKVIIIRPSNDKEHTLTKSPIKFVKAFKDTPFSKVEMADVRFNKIKNIAVAELKTADPAVVGELLKVNKIGNWNVTCNLPVKDKLKVGVISPIDIDEDLNEIKESIEQSLIDDFSMTTLYKIERLNKILPPKPGQSKGEMVQSPSIKLSFVTNSLPDKVKIGPLSFNVRPFVFPPTQCFKCQRFGHTIGSCKNSTYRCKLCSGSHGFWECPHKDDQYRKCINCSGSHAASSYECERKKAAVEVEKLRSKGNTYDEARTLVMEKSSRKSSSRPTPTTGPPSNNLTHHTITPDFHHSMNSQVNTNLPKKKSYRDTVSNSFKTPCPNCNRSAPRDAEQLVELPTGDFLEKISNCFIKILSSLGIDSYNSSVQENTVKTIVKDTFSNKSHTNKISSTAVDEEICQELSGSWSNFDTVSEDALSFTGFLGEEAPSATPVGGTSGKTIIKKRKRKKRKNNGDQ